MVLTGQRVRQRREQPCELAPNDLCSTEEFVGDPADHAYVVGDQPVRTVATRTAECVAEGLVGKNLLCEVEDVSLVSKSFHVVKNLNITALASVLATHSDGDLIG